ncbi:MAG: glycosyltransferase family 4 protein [bacterium]|nr:glycosyltransferase family 4 protein [bacterium]
MNILFITPWYPTEENPVWGIFVQKQAEVLAEDHRIVVLHGMGMSLIQYFRDGGTTVSNKNGVEEIRFYYPELPLLARFFYLLKVRKLFKAMNRRSKINVVHAHVTLPAGLAAVLLGRLYKIPSVLTEHASFLKNELKNKKKHSLISYAWKNADVLIAVSLSLKNIIENTLKRDIKIIPNVIDTDFFKRGSLQSATSDPVKMIFIGHMNADSKGVDLLLKAMSNIQNMTDRQLELHLYGSGVNLAGYKQMAVDLNIEKRCYFHGEQMPEQIRDGLINSDFFVLPSRAESFSIVTAEAMACGKPVIVTKCGGPEEFVDDVSGYVIPPDDQAELDKAILKMISEYRDFDPDEIAEIIKNSFSKKVFIDQMNEIYNRISEYKAETHLDLCQQTGKKI